ncbi:MAG: hypothetical protein AAGB93_19590 [Planctomycetota bacterium]
MAHAPVAAQQFRALGSVRVRIDTDGTVLVVPGTANGGEGIALARSDDVVRIATDPRAVLVDREGIEWIWDRGSLVGMRDGAVVQERPKTRVVPRPLAMEDAEGVRWFWSESAIDRFDGATWTRRPVPGLFGSPRSARAALSDDRRHLYFWTERDFVAAAIDVETGRIATLDPEAGGRRGRFRQIVPLDGGSVAVTSGCRLLGPGDRKRLPPSNRMGLGRLGPRSPEPDVALDRFVVSGDASFLDSHGGPLILRVRDCRRASAIPPADSEALLPFDARENVERRLSSASGFVLLRVDRDFGTERARPIEEAFEPTYVDRSGRLWRHPPTHLAPRGGARSLSFLEDDQLWTLTDAADGEAVDVDEFVGVDRRGRAYISLGHGGLVVFDPTARAAEGGRLAWRASPVELWTPQREAEARELVRASIREQDLFQAYDVARRFGEIARMRRDRLEDPVFWRDITRALVVAKNPGDARQLLAETRATDLAGLESVTAQRIAALWSELQKFSGPVRIVRAAALAEVLELRGDLQGALEAHSIVMETETHSGGVGSGRASEAARCAARLRRHARALGWLRRGADAARGRDRTRLEGEIEALERYLEDPDALDASLDLLTSYWMPGGDPDRRRRGAGDAIAHVLEHHEPTGEPYRFLLTALIDERIASRAWTAAGLRIEELADAGGLALERALGAQLALSEARLEAEHVDAAITAFERLRDLGAGTAFEHRGRLGVARAHLRSGDPRAAYRAAKPLVPLFYGASRPAYGLDLRDGQALALLLVRAFEELGYHDEALPAARDARTRFPVREWGRSGHSHGPKRSDLEVLVERLEARVGAPR